jgi:CRISPR system Cascade subunit CasA
MSATMNLLDDPVFTVRTPAGQDMCSLPRIYALLGRDEVEGFAKLQAHQKQAWHCFLAQLGAIATEDREMPDAEGGWREALAALAEPEAWNLYTKDLRKPAFMQPPGPDWALEALAESTRREALNPYTENVDRPGLTRLLMPVKKREDFSEIHPTEYDVPVLSKSHALKLRRMHTPEPEHWVYLLVNVQTTGFYSPGGRRNSRMNGSYASRPFFGLTPSLRLGQWIMHDIRVLKEHVSEIEEHYDYERNVTPLLWTEPWDGKESIELKELHPLYIDCARRIRKGHVWMKSTTSTERVAGAAKGQTGDPWAPVNTSEDKVLNPGRPAFQYRKLSKILFSGNYRRPISFKETADGYVVCRAVTGEQGGRVHDLQRIIRFSNAESGDPFAEPDESTVAEEAEWRVERAGEAAAILSHALFLMLKDDRDDGEQEEVPDLLQEGKNRQVNAFHSRVDACFFEKLFEAPAFGDDQRNVFWETILVGALHTQMQEAQSLCPAKDRWRRLARAQAPFERRIRTTFTYAKQTNTTATHEHEEPYTEGEGMGEPDARAVADV